MIRVLVVDDHAVVRAGLAEVLGGAADVEIVGAVGDADEAVAATERSSPHVVLMDLSMPRKDGIEATREIISVAPDTKVVVLTSFSDRERILRALDAGAVGYLLKDTEPEALLAGVRAAAHGDSPLAPRAARELLAEREARRPSAELSTRERDVLFLVARGRSNKQIARELGISEKTVKAHLTSVFRQLGVFDRTQAALWAREHGLLES